MVCGNEVRKWREVLAGNIQRMRIIVEGHVTTSIRGLEKKESKADNERILGEQKRRKEHRGVEIAKVFALYLERNIS